MPNDWGAYDRLERSFHRARSSMGRATLKLGDDTGPVQLWQLEGYPTELRDGVQRLGSYGLTTMPLPGAKAHVAWQGGYRAHGIVTSIEDPRYRPKNLKGAEFLLYVVTGADAEGKNGTMRPVLKGTKDGDAILTGIHISIGDNNTVQVTIKGSTKVTVTAPEVDISNGGTLQAVKLADGSNSTVLKAQ
jgi:phage baseplate assembly protein V